MKRFFLSSLAVFLFVCTQVFLVGHSDPEVITTQIWSSKVAFNTKTFGPMGLDGTSNHSVAYDYTGAVSIAVEVGYVDPALGTVNYLPAGVGPFTGTSGIEPLFLPVSQYVRFTVTGTAVTGNLIFNGA